MLGGIAATVAVLLAFAAVVLALNAGTYSAGGFVTRYLDALARRDLAVALTTPGVELPAGASRAALTREGLGRLGDHRIVGDRDDGEGRHIVTAEYRLGSATRRSDFVVEAGPRIALFFAGWRFAESPATTLDVSALHASSFRVNGVSVSGAPLGPGGGATSGSTTSLAVLSPGAFVIDEDSRYLRAAPVTLEVTGAVPTAGTVDIRASNAFDEAVRTEVRNFLDRCATQQILRPGGCPFGKEVQDRVTGAPTWSIAGYPEIDLQPGATPAGDFAWTTASGGVAHIRVDVMSLFDGTRSTLDEDVPFTAAYAVTIRSDGGLDIRAD